MSNTSTCPVSDPIVRVMWLHGLAIAALAYNTVWTCVQKQATNMLGIVDIAVCMAKCNVAEPNTVDGDILIFKHPSIHSSIHPPIHPSINTSIHPFICVHSFIHPSVSVSILPPINPSIIPPSIHSSACPFIHPSVSLSIHPSISVSVHQSVYSSSCPANQPDSQPVLHSTRPPLHRKVFVDKTWI